MAAYNVVRAESATLTGTTADVVTLNGVYVFGVQVINRSGAGPLSVTVDGATPTALGDDCLVVMPGDTVLIPLFPRAGGVVVRVVGDGNQYTVQLL